MSKRSRARNKQLRNKRQKQKAAAQTATASTTSRVGNRSTKLNRRTLSRVAEASNLIDSGDFDAAEEILTTEDWRHAEHPDILWQLLYLYQNQQDHRMAAMTAQRFLRVKPRESDIWLSLAQSYLFCGRSVMALNAYRHFLSTWPDHEHRSKAETATELLETHLAEMLDEFDLSEDEFELLLRHDEILFELSTNRHEEAVGKARELLAVKPRLVSARNNMTIALFQLGKMKEAVATCRETLLEFPGNRFAQASLGRYLMLSGHSEEATAIADSIVADPSDQQDAIAHQVELLSMLGRDDDVLKLVACGEQIPDKDPKCVALLLHHKAVALARKGNPTDAKEYWQQSVKLFPHYDPARENLEDFALPPQDRHAPWPESLTSWIPQRVMEDFSTLVRQRAADGDEFPISTALKRFPRIVSLVPALLDRGDSTGRELAFQMATTVKSPEFLDALQEFAAGVRGPDKLRHEALSVLKQNGRLDAGPHRLFRNGQWTEIEIFSPVITDKPTPAKSPELQELHEEGYIALDCGDWKTAEPIFRRCMELDPNDPAATHNLAGALMLSDDEAQLTEARELLEDLRERFPDYLFAQTSLAQLALRDGDLQTARDLIAPLLRREEMHRSEAIGLLTVQANLAFAHDNMESAEVTVSMMQKIDPDHPNSRTLRRRLEFANGRTNRVSGPKGIETRPNLTSRLT